MIDYLMIRFKLLIVHARKTFKYALKFNVRNIIHLFQRFRQRRTPIVSCLTGLAVSM
jgi:hypothetical protein